LVLQSLKTRVLLSLGHNRVLGIWLTLLLSFKIKKSSLYILTLFLSQPILFFVLVEVLLGLFPSLYILDDIGVHLLFILLYLVKLLHLVPFVLNGQSQPLQVIGLDLLDLFHFERVRIQVLFGDALGDGGRLGLVALEVLVRR